MNRLKQLRNEFGYTVRDIEKITGFNNTSVSFYENETRNMNVSIIITFADLYQVTIDYLLNYSDLGIYVIDEDKNTLLLDDKNFKELLKNNKIVYIDRKRHLTN